MDELHHELADALAALLEDAIYSNIPAKRRSVTEAGSVLAKYQKLAPPRKKDEAPYFDTAIRGEAIDRPGKGR